MSFRNLIIGYSGHSYVVIEAAMLNNIEIAGYTDLGEKSINPYNIPYFGNERDLNFKWDNCENFILGIGDNKTRSEIGNLIHSKNKNCLTIIHPHSSISYTSKIGKGTFVNKGVAINSLVDIGDFVIINTNASIDHGCKIGDNVHIAPGAVIAGDVIIKRNCFIGANSVIKEGSVIEEYTTIGAGSVVLRNTKKNSVYFGNPAKNKNQKNGK